MKHFLAVFTVVSVGLIGTATAVAQDTDKTQDKMSSKTVTGCLSQGSGSGGSNASGSMGDYMLRDSSGKTYDLTGTKVNLKPHVGHEVSITGSMSGGMSSTNSGSSSSGHNDGTLMVSDLKMVSSTCK